MPTNGLGCSRGKPEAKAGCEPISESVDALLGNGVTRLAGRSDSPRADALLLLAYVIGRRREWIAAHGDAEPSPEEEARFSMLCDRRAAGTPIAYLLGCAHFYGRAFVVNESVLVPRPETEHLVDEALRFIGNAAMRVLDVGTGSGAIACTIAAESNATIDATDISPAALEIAERNAARLGVANRCRFYQGDLIEPVRASRYGVVVANLPYIPTIDLPTSPEPASFEPAIALDGGSDGLALYERLLPALREVIEQNGLLLLEAAPPTIRALEALARRHLPGFTIEARKDYAGLDRYLIATLTYSPHR